jgi:hypothetical protein
MEGTREQKSLTAENAEVAERENEAAFETLSVLGVLGG